MLKKFQNTITSINYQNLTQSSLILLMSLVSLGSSERTWSISPWKRPHSNLLEGNPNPASPVDGCWGFPLLVCSEQLIFRIPQVELYLYTRSIRQKLRTTFSVSGYFATQRTRVTLCIKYLFTAFTSFNALSL